MLNNSYLLGAVRNQFLNKWPELSSEEIEETNGDAEKLAGLLEKKYGTGYPEALKKVNEILSTFQNDFGSEVSKEDDTHQEPQPRNPINSDIERIPPEFELY